MSVASSDPSEGRLWWAVGNGRGVQLCLCGPVALPGHKETGNTGISKHGSDVGWAWGAARKKGGPGAEGGSPESRQTQGDRGARAEGALLGRFWGDVLGRTGARGRTGMAWAGAGSLEPVWRAREPPRWGESEGETPVRAGGGPRCGRTEGDFGLLCRLRVTCEWGQYRLPQSSVFTAVCDVEAHSKYLSGPGGIRLRARGWVGGLFRKRICSRHPCELVTLALRGGCRCDCREGQTHHCDPLLPACCAL